MLRLSHTRYEGTPCKKSPHKRIKIKTKDDKPGIRIPQITLNCCICDLTFHNRKSDLGIAPAVKIADACRCVVNIK